MKQINFELSDEGVKRLEKVCEKFPGVKMKYVYMMIFLQGVGKLEGEMKTLSAGIPNRKKTVKLRGDKRKR